METIWFGLCGNHTKNIMHELADKFLEMQLENLSSYIIHKKRYWIYKEHNDGWIMIQGFIQVEKDIQSGVCQETHEYYCYFCKTWSDKNLWGPGRIWCPNCKGQQLSPADIIKQCEDFGPMAPLMPNRFFND